MIADLASHVAASTAARGMPVASGDLRRSYDIVTEFRNVAPKILNGI
jgi:hypothetical protein